MNEKKINEKKVLLNVSYLLFCKKIINEKLEAVNIEKLNLEYEMILNLKVSNCERVIKRVLRVENEEKLNNNLKSMNINKASFLKLSARLINENKVHSNKYI